MMRFLPMRRRQNHLSQTVVDLVGARVQQVFAFEIYVGATQIFAQPLGVIKPAWLGRRTARVAPVVSA